MRRRLLIAGIFLLAGAVVNVAVAWVCPAGVVRKAKEQSASYHKAGDAESHTEVWRVIRWMKFGRTLVRSERFTGPGSLAVYVDEDRSLRPGQELVRGHHPRDLVPYWADVPRPSRVDVEIQEEVMIIGQGWPLRAMSGVAEWSRFDPRPWVIGPDYHGKWIPGGEFRGLSIGYSEPWGLPLRPIWPGFAVNTVFYAPLLWLLILGPFAVRRFLRVRRGLCPACAYPVGEGPLCTECGRELPRAAT